MKKVLFIFITILCFFILSICIYWNLPFEITRKSDMKFGNKLIENIESYKGKYNKLPEQNDWETLEKIGFKIEMLGTKPSYEFLQNDEYELVFLEGFDGPYLMWNSKEKKWKLDYPTILTNSNKKYERENLVYEKDNEKLIYIVSQTGLDNYLIEFFTIDKSDSLKIFEDYINDAVFTSKTYKITQTDNCVTIKSPFTTKTIKVKTRNNIEVKLTN